MTNDTDLSQQPHTHQPVADLLISTIFALLMVAISLFLRAFPDCYYPASMKPPVFIGIISFLTQFPLTLFSFYPYSLVASILGLGSLGLLLAELLMYIVSFIFKLIIFYFLQRFTKGILGKKNTFLPHYGVVPRHHLPSLLIFVISFSFIAFYFLQECQL